MERGVWSSLSVFTPAAKIHPKMEQQIYDYAKETQASNIIPEMIIYIDTPPEVCAERIRSRGVEYEQDINMVYLSELDHLYYEAFTRYNGTVFHVDGTQSRAIVCKQVEEIISNCLAGRQPDIIRGITFQPRKLWPPTPDQQWEYTMHQDTTTTKR